jgi:hypothetical protein
MGILEALCSLDHIYSVFILIIKNNKITPKTLFLYVIDSFFLGNLRLWILIAFLVSTVSQAEGVWSDSKFKQPAFLLFSLIIFVYCFSSVFVQKFKDTME